VKTIASRINKCLKLFKKQVKGLLSSLNSRHSQKNYKYEDSPIAPFSEDIESEIKGFVVKRENLIFFVE